VAVDYAERGRATEKRHAAAKHRQRGLGKKDQVLERGRAVERAASQAKHKPRWRQRERDRTTKDDDEYEAWRENYFRNVRPDLDPQSTMSKMMEFVGLDDNPYARDARSYDYRSEGAAEGDVSFLVPELTDEQARDTGGFIERTLGYFNPNLYMPGYQPAQRPSQDERVLAQLSPEDRAAVEGMDPDQADAALKDMFPDWSPKMHPFPTSMMGDREREGDSRIGWMPHFIDQFNYSPYSTEDIFSFLSPDSPETIRRDIDAWKGGSSSLDRTIIDAVGGDPEAAGPPTENPFVDPVEWGSAGIAVGIPGMLGGAVRGGKKAVGVGKKVLDRIKKPTGLPKPPKRGRPPVGISDPPPTWPGGPRPQPPVGIDDIPGGRFAVGGSVRNDINRAIRARNSAHTPPPSGAAGALAAMGIGGAVAAPIGLRGLEEQRKRRKRDR
jgi:hypothetical protein